MRVDPDFDYAEAHVPDPWRIMGVRLGPFRVGHKLILQQAKSPFFAKKDAPIGSKDLTFALWVCSRSYAEAKRYQSERLSLIWEIWALRIAWKAKRDGSVLESRIQMFLDYLIEAHKTPRVRRASETEPDESDVPTLMVLKGELMEMRKYTEEEFFELPMRQALFDFTDIQRRKEHVSFPERWERGEE